MAFLFNLVIVLAPMARKRQLFLSNGAKWLYNSHITSKKIDSNVQRVITRVSRTSKVTISSGKWAPYQSLTISPRYANLAKSTFFSYSSIKSKKCGIFSTSKQGFYLFLDVQFHNQAMILSLIFLIFSFINNTSPRLPKINCQKSIVLDYNNIDLF